MSPNGSGALAFLAVQGDVGLRRCKEERQGFVQIRPLMTSHNVRIQFLQPSVVGERGHFVLHDTDSPYAPGTLSNARPNALVRTGLLLSIAYKCGQRASLGVRDAL